MSRLMREGNYESMPDGAASDGEWLAVHLPALRAYVRRRAGRRLLEHESVSDLVQSAIRELLEDLPRIDLEGAQRVAAWLRLCAERKIVDRARRLERRPDPASLDEDLGKDPQIADPSAPPEDRAAAREEIERLQQALELLPPGYREILEMAQIERLPYEEIARRTGRSRGAVKNIVLRAKARLAALLDGSSRRR